MTIMSWLVVFTYSAFVSGNIKYGLIAFIGVCFAHLAANILDDYFASIALENRDFIDRRNFEIMHSGVNVLKSWLEANPEFRCILPSGGTTVLLKYKYDIPSREYCKKLQNSTGVALLPGETMEMEGYARLGFCADNLGEALDRISKFKP